MPPAIVPIRDLDDPRVEVFRDVRDRDLRGRERLFMAESELVVRRLLESPRRLRAILVNPVKLDALAAALAVLGPDVPVYVVEPDLMTRISGFHVHRGVLAAGIRPAPGELCLDAALGHLKRAGRVRLLIGEALTNVDNMGALFRNAAAFGLDGVVLDPTCCDPLYRKAIRVSMGHVLAMPYAVSASWPGDLARLKTEWGVTLVGAEVSRGAVPVWDMPRDERLGVVLGSEGDGLSAATRDACDLLCEIPMSDGVPSINVAVASAVFLYELSRRP